MASTRKHRHFGDPLPGTWVTPETRFLEETGFLIAALQEYGPLP